MKVLGTWTFRGGRNFEVISIYSAFLFFGEKTCPQLETGSTTTSMLGENVDFWTKLPHRRQQEN
jgi:hypothetical protein